MNASELTQFLKKQYDNAVMHTQKSFVFTNNNQYKRFKRIFKRDALKLGMSLDEAESTLEKFMTHCKIRKETVPALKKSKTFKIYIRKKS